MPIQNHIHLSTTLNIDAENAPSWKWKILERLNTPIVLAEVQRTLGGKLRPHRLLDNTSSVIRLQSVMYKIKVSNYGDGITKDERMEAIRNMVGEFVYVVDSDHPNNGEDHTAHVVPMYLAEITEIVALDPMLQTEYVSVRLEDNSL